MKKILVLLVATMMVGISAIAQSLMPLLPSDGSLGDWVFTKGDMSGVKGEIKRSDNNGVSSFTIHNEFSEGIVMFGGAILPMNNMNVDTLSMDVTAPESVNELGLRLIDSTEQCHQIKLSLEPTGKKQHIEFPVIDFFEKRGTPQAVSGVKNYQKWGGANDGKYHPPLKKIILMTRKPSPATKELDVLIENPCIKVRHEVISDVKIKMKHHMPIGKAGEHPPWSLNLGQEFKGAQGDMVCASDETGLFIRCNMNFENGGGYVGVHRQPRGIPQDAEASKVIFDLRIEGAKAYVVRLRDGSGQYHQLRYNDGNKDWVTKEIDLKKMPKHETWGGAKDGKWHGTIGLFSVHIAKKALGQNTQAQFDLKNPTIEYEMPAPKPRVVSGYGFDNQADIDDWQKDGDVKVEKQQPFGGVLCIKQDDKDVSRTATYIRTPIVEANPGKWVISGKAMYDMVSPDMSFNVCIKAEWRRRDGAIIETSEGPLFTGSSKDWENFSKTIIAPMNTVSASLKIEMAKADGVFRLDDLNFAFAAAEKSHTVNKIKISSKAQGNLFYPADEVSFDIKLECRDYLSEGYRKLSYYFADAYNKAVSEEKDINLDEVTKVAKDGTIEYTAKIVTQKNDFEIGKYYRIVISVTDAENGTASEISGFARLEEARANSYDPREIPFTSRNWDNRGIDYIDLSHRLGIRVASVWGDWSPKGPTYKPKAMLLERLAEHKMGASVRLASFKHEKDKAKDYTDDSWRNGAEAFIRYCNSIAPVIYAYLGNEPKGDLEQAKKNVRVYKLVYEGVKAADKDVIVLASSMGPEEKYFEAGFQDACDQYDYHTYGPWTGIDKINQKYKDLFEKYKGSKKPICSTELGNSTFGTEGVSRPVIANNMVKVLAEFFRNGNTHACWFGVCFKDPQGKRRGTFGEAFDIFDSHYSLYNPKVDAITLYHCINELGTRVFKKYDIDKNETRYYSFVGKRNEGLLYVVWNEKNLCKAEVLVPTGKQKMGIRSIDGSRKLIDVKDKKSVFINVTSSPIFVDFE